MQSEQIEEYLKTIYNRAGNDGIARTTSVAKCSNISPPSVVKAIKKMAGKGLVIYKLYKGAILTKERLEVATKIKRNHSFLEVFFTDVLHLNKEKALAEVRKMENISDETEITLYKTMVIGTCEEYRSDTGTQEQKSDEKDIVRITDLKPCERGVIAFLRGDRKVVQRLSDLGLTLHTEIKLLRKAPMNGPIEVCVRRTNLAIAREIADNIFVNVAGKIYDRL
jgi:DtxR family transcriptional regulator, Mn-dependent transcriptional regulator